MRKIVSGTLALLLAAGIASYGGNVYAAEPDAVTVTDTQKELALEPEDAANKTSTEQPFTAGEISGTGWKLDEAGVLTLSENVPFVQGQPYEWAQYAEQIKEVVVAEGVTEIPNLAFSTDENQGIRYSNLQKVTMSSSVKYIRPAAFAYNPSLKEVYLNNGLEEVGNIAFAGAGFTEIHLPEGVTWSSDVFYECDNLVSVTIPKGSKWGGSNAHFYGCDSLTTVIIEEGVEEIPATFLNGCTNLQYVWIPKSVTNIVGTPILDGACIIGYKGTVAEEYVNSPTGQINKLTFHAIDGEEHTFGEWQIIQNATCTDKGIMKHTCTICNAERTQEVAPTGHKWDSGKVTQEATEKAEGVKTYTCTVCGTTKTESIPKLAPSGNENTDKSNVKDEKVSAQNSVNPPETGDSADVLGWALLLAVSAGAITVFCIKKRAAR
ncbi:hypothetical protein EUBC25_05650 [Claveliimonas bilis]|uniref:leucine-rich repeat domain-containing protein n=1 Tax=Claveliimonas bilis TaxID=3028070 RepID=UPI001E4BABA9|nr:leucine-rich repeat domain-containing protein [Claveliimonas bilis]BCZ26478.1 hypothetical protein EUBC25_05650 [Claveliimonas bilis]